MTNNISIPPERYKRMGWPWHGFFRHGSGSNYTLEPNNAGPNKAFTNLTSHDYQPYVVRNHTLPTDTRTAEEIAADDALHYDWQEYALAYSSNNKIYNATLGSNNWIFCDEAGTPWVVYVTITSGVTTFTVTLKLKRRFGVIGDTVSTLNTTLDTFTADLADYSLTQYFGGTTALSLGSASTSPSEDGAEAFINIYQQQSILACVLEVSLSGTGDTTSGSGISGSIASFKDGAALNPTYNHGLTWSSNMTASDTDMCDPDNVADPCATTVDTWRHWTGDLSFYLYYAKTTEGTQAYTYYEDWDALAEATSTWSISGTPPACSRSNIDCTASTTIDRNWSVACNGATVGFTESIVEDVVRVSYGPKLLGLARQGLPMVLQAGIQSSTDYKMLTAYGDTTTWASATEDYPVYHPVLQVWDSGGFWL